MGMGIGLRLVYTLRFVGPIWRNPIYMLRFVGLLLFVLFEIQRQKSARFQKSVALQQIFKNPADFSTAQSFSYKIGAKSGPNRADKS